MNIFTLFKKSTAIILMLFSLYAIHNAPAQAIEKPSVMTQKSGDASQADSLITKIIDYILYFVYAAGVIALVISLLMCTPYIGNTQNGLKGIKGSLGVLFGAILLHIIIGFVGSLSV